MCLRLCRNLDFLSIRFVSFRFVSFRFVVVSCRFVSFRFVSFRFVSFRFVSFRFVSFLSLNFCFVCLFLLATSRCSSAPCNCIAAVGPLYPPPECLQRGHMAVVHFEFKFEFDLELQQNKFAPVSTRPPHTLPEHWVAIDFTCK